MIRLPPSSPRTYPLLPYTTLFRSHVLGFDHAPSVHAARRHAALPGARLSWPDLLVDRRGEASQPAPGRQDTRAIHRTDAGIERSEEHTSELQSLMRISYAVFCLKKQKNNH